MVLRTLADVTVVLHFAFILFVVFGGFLVARRRAAAYVHAPALCWAAATGWRCPLTMLEKWLRVKGGMGGYFGDFVHHWIIEPLFYPGVVSPPLRAAFLLVPLTTSALGYWWAFRPPPPPVHRTITLRS
jgi:hypothetical protein